MILQHIALVILLSGGADGGRAVSTELKFSSMDVCEAAADRLAKALGRATGYVGTAAVCVVVR
jgi:hypothetical protein